MLEQPTFPFLVKRFLYQQLYPSSEVLFSEAPASSLNINGTIHIFHSSKATFCAPSDISGIHGMRCEHIRATSSWRGGPARYDCILINSDPNVEGAHGFEVACVFLFFSFQYEGKKYSCALIQPEPKEWDHAVELIPGSKPSGCKIYPLSPAKQKELDVFLKENLETGII